MSNYPDDLTPLQIILAEGGVHPRASYYTGRRSNAGDLDARILNKIYDGILREFGEKAANAYLDVLENLPEATATDFLNRIFRLEANDWVYEDSKTNGKCVDNIGSLLANLAESLSNPTKLANELGLMNERPAIIQEMTWEGFLKIERFLNSDKTPDILNPILRKHKRKVRHKYFYFGHGTGGVYFRDENGKEYVRYQVNFNYSKSKK